MTPRTSSEFEQGKKVALAGMRQCQNASCKCLSSLIKPFEFTLMHHSRTYGKNIGEDVREGFEPTDNVAVTDPKDEEESTFKVGGSDKNDEDSEESRQWKQASEPALLLKPKYGLDGEAGEAFENVWGGADSSQPPPENP